MACNLLDVASVPPEVVEARVRELAAVEGISVLESYRIGKTPDELVLLGMGG